ncbi:MAG: hypothetical protein LBS30_04560, partial [Planctomycetota bacterium]|nr:hypothetical protein [Planctomycetota bacterium]
MKKFTKLFAIPAVVLMAAAMNVLGGDMTCPVLIPEPEKLYTVGPNGEDAAWYDQVSLTADEVAKVKAMGVRVAIEGSNESDWVMATTQGYKDAAAILGFEIVSETTSELDPSRQKENMENFAALGVDVVISQAQEVELAAPSYDPLVKRGVKLVYT